MSTTNYDAETGIYYGVIAQNSVSPEAFDDVWTQARDLTFEQAQFDFKAQIKRITTEADLAELITETFGKDRGPSAENWAGAILDGITLADGEQTEETIAAIWNELEQTWNDQYSDSGAEMTSWWYEKEGYKLTDCLDSDIFVLKSPFFTYARKCSPCVPGAGDLNNPVHSDTDASEVHAICESQGISKTYCLGHDFFDDGKAPYRVYSVETSALVEPVMA